MKKIVLTITLFVSVIFVNAVFCQVGIGTMEPDKSAALDVVNPTPPERPLGVLIPRMTQAERDHINNPANGLLIFNIDEECLNAYDAYSVQWNSLCGGVGKSVFTIGGCDDITVYGTYVQGTSTNASNYLSVNINVANIGAYTLTATTANGYAFSVQGVFVVPGEQTITVPAQGKPENTSPGDHLSFILNGVETDVCSSLTIEVLPPVSSYTMTCGSAKVEGVYQLGVALNSSNRIILPVMVSDISNGGSWSVTTNTVNGISFSGSGTFSVAGAQTVPLQGTGTPSAVAPVNLTLTSNSGGSVATTCNVTIQVAYSPMTIYASDGGSAYGYGLEVNSASRAFVMSPRNFGTMENSTVKTTGLTVTYQYSPSDASFQTTLTINPPDIVVIGYAWSWTTPKILTLMQYLNNKGVVILLDESNSAVAAQGLFTRLYATPVSTTGASAYNEQDGNYYGPYTLASLSNDPILTGPFLPDGFNTLGGLGWGSDAGGANLLSGLPSTLIVYSTGYTTARGQGVTMFRDPNLNLFFAGDGGFLSFPDGSLGTAGVYNSTTACPFAITPSPNYQPMPRTGWYGGTVVYNSYLFGNILAWAINQAQYNGIKHYQ